MKGKWEKDFKSLAKKFDRKYVHLTLTPSLLIQWDAEKKPDDKVIEEHAGLWFKKEGGRLLGLDGQAFKDLHYSKMSAEGKELKLVFEGSGNEGSRIDGVLTLVSLKTGSGTAKVKNTSRRRHSQPAWRMVGRSRSTSTRS